MSKTETDNGVSSTMTEDDLLLGEFDSAGIEANAEYDEDALLGDDPDLDAPAVTTSQSPNVAETETKSESGNREEETEELDYDEDEEQEREKRSGKFTSERNPASNTSSAVTDSDLAKGASSARGGMASRGRGSFTVAGRGRAGFSNGSSGPGGKILVNPNFRPQVSLRIGDGPVVNMNAPRPYGMMQPQPLIPGLTTQNIARGAPLFGGRGAPMGQFVGGRPPQGMPNMPVNVLRNTVLNQALMSTGRGMPMQPPMMGGPGVPGGPMGMHMQGPPPQLNFTTRPPGAAGPQPLMATQIRPQPQQWDTMVEGFLNRTQRSGGEPGSPRRRRRHSSSSFSSYSSYSSFSSRSRSRSRSRSPRDRRSHRESRRDDRPRLNRNYHGSRGRDERRPYVPREHRSSRRHGEERTLESAKALGLDQDYLKKVEEQKRTREEIVRQKEQRRQGHRDSGASSSRNDERDHRRAGGGDRESSRKGESSTSSSAREERKKPYLVAVIRNVEQLTTARVRVEKLATAIGPIKKCWQSTPDSVSVIFNEHEHAKQFMIQHNNKVLSGLRITVKLEKEFLYPSEVGQ